MKNGILRNSRQKNQMNFGLLFSFYPFTFWAKGAKSRVSLSAKRKELFVTVGFV